MAVSGRTSPKNANPFPFLDTGEDMSKNLDRHPLAAIRQNCLDCAESRKDVLWCPCDGLHSDPSRI
jgi:hypothetical protein